jgi:hypothetical protein
MMDMGLIAFIMDEQTLEFMDEFELLRNAPYQTFYIDDEARVMSTDGTVPVTFEDARHVVNHDMTCEELLSRKGCSWFSTDFSVAENVDAQEITLPAADEVESPAMSGDADVTFDDDIPFGEADVESEPDEYAAGEDDDYFDPDSMVDESMGDIDAALDNAASASSPAMTPQDVPADAQQGAFQPNQPAPAPIDPFGPPMPVYMDDQAANADEISQQAQQSSMGREDAMYQQAPAYPQGNAMPAVTTPTDVTNVIRSAYFTHDLGLHISCDPFDEQFGEGNPLPHFSEDRGTGFMAEYLTEVSREANADMRHLRDSNLHNLRERYVHLMSMTAKRISEQLDVSDETSTYGRMRKAIIDDFNRQREDVDERVAAMRTALQENYDRGMREAVDLASAQARQTYRHNHEGNLKQSIMDAESKVMSEIESEYQSAINKMYDQRRSEAAKKMDAATAEILGLLSHEYSTMYVDEYRLYRQYRDDIGRWVDENRKNDIAYAETLREEQRQAEKADAVRDDYTKRLEEQAAEFEQRRLRLEEDISRTQARHEEFIHDLETRHEEELTSLRNKNAELQEQFNDLLDRYSSLDATKAQEYDLRLKQAQDEAETERKRAEQAGEQNRITWRMVIILFIVALIAALGIGIIIGMRQNIDYVTDLVAASNAALPIGV